MTIAEFLLARIAEDEKQAEGGVRYEVAIHYSGGGDWESLEERWLAECAAKKAIVAVHREESLDGSTEDDLQYYAEFPEEAPRSRCAECSCYSDCVVSLNECRTLRALAAIYAAHPDYDESWTL